MIICLLLFLGLNMEAQEGYEDWSNIPAQSNVVGKLILSSILTGDSISRNLINSQDGPDEYAEESQRHFEVKFITSIFSDFKYLSVRVIKMKVDYLSDSALFNNDDYLSNNFVYKAVRADTVRLYLKKKTAINLSVSDIFGSQLFSEIKRVIPQFDSLKIAYQSKDSLVINIANPRVYFKVLAMKLTKNCGDCRMSWGVAVNKPEEKEINMDISDVSTRFAVLTINFGNHPAFTLKLGQDPVNKKNLVLELVCQQSFVIANNYRIPAKVVVPVDVTDLDGKEIRQFLMVNHYLGSIKTTTSNTLFRKGSALNIPVFFSITAQQISDRKVKLINKLDNGAFVSKLEYPNYTYSIYNGEIL
jgi:hypothetical protein